MGDLFGGGDVDIGARQTLDIGQLGSQAATADITQLEAGLAAEDRFLPGQRQLREGSTQALSNQLLQQLPPGLQQRLVQDFFTQAPKMNANIQTVITMLPMGTCLKLGGLIINLFLPWANC